MILPLEIKNQRGTDFCASCVISSIAEEYTHEVCEESYLAAAAKFYSKDPIEKYGVSPRKIISAVIKYGVLPKKLAYYGIDDKDRNFLVDWNNWKFLERFAIKPFNSSVRIRNFDEAIRQMEKYNTSLMCGIFWQAHWNSPYIETLGEFNKLSPHEVRIIGVKNDKLILQNSRGLGEGENGIFYLSREAFKAVNHIYRLSPEKVNPIINYFNNL